MARISNRDRIVNIVEDMSKGLQGQVADLLQSIVNLQASEDLSDLEDSTVSSSRRTKTKDKPAAKKTRKSRKSDDDDDDEKPARRTRRPKAEAFDDTPTMDDCYDFLMEFEGEPVSGGIRELKPEVVKLGGDPDAITEDGDSRSERVEAFGMFIAASKALAAKLALHDEDDLEELAEELDVEPSKSKKKTINDIIVALNSAEAEAEEDDDVEDDDEEEDDDEPKARRGRKSKSSKGATKKRRTKSSKSDDDDDDDEEGLDEIDDID